MSGRAALALTAGSAWLTSLAFPERSWSLLGWVGLAPFLAVVWRVSPLRAASLGALWALVFSVAVGHWLPAGLALYFDHGAAFGWLTFFGMLAVMVAPYLAAFAAASAALARRTDAALPLLTAAAWAAAEWGRGALFVLTGHFVGNPWALLGYSQADVAPLAQLASVTGIYGISFVLVLSSATLADQARRWVEGRFRARGAARAFAVAALPAVLAFAYGWSVLPAGADPSLEREGTTVAIVQGHIGLGERWHRYFHGRNLGTYLELSNGALESSDAEIVVWPEAAMTFLFDEQPDYRRSIESLLRVHDVELISGIPHREHGADASESLYNSVYLLAPDGSLRARYDKAFLLPFAEYLPVGRFEIVRTLFGRFREYARGATSPPLPTRAGPAGVLVCNEAVLPEVARQRVREGATWLVNPSNDSWSRHPKFTGQWFDIVRFRAIEQRRYLVRASTSGPSAVVDPWGRVFAPTERYARGVATARIRPLEERSLYGRVGDLFALGCTLAVGVALLRRPSPARHSAAR